MRFFSKIRHLFFQDKVSSSLTVVLSFRVLSSTCPAQDLVRWPNRSIFPEHPLMGSLSLQRFRSWEPVLPRFSYLAPSALKVFTFSAVCFSPDLLEIFHSRTLLGFSLQSFPLRKSRGISRHPSYPLAVPTLRVSRIALASFPIRLG